MLAKLGLASWCWPRTHRCCAGIQERSHVQELRADRRSRFPEFVPIAEINLKAELFATYLREAPSGSSPGPGGCINEMLKVCPDNTEALHLLTLKAFTMAETRWRNLRDRNQHVLAQIGGQDIGQAVHVGRGDSLRALPFQFALSTRAGTPCNLSPITIWKRLSSPSMARGPVITCTARVCDPSCLSSDRHTHGSRRIGWLMRMGEASDPAT